MFLGETGIPILKMDLANMSLADAEPVPLTLAKRMTKSFTPLVFPIPTVLWSRYTKISACPRQLLDSVLHKGRNADRRPHL